MKKKRAKGLKKALRFMVRMDKSEILEFYKMAKQARLSRVEYARRKILNIPVADATQRTQEQAVSA